jgi:4-carboxymuconolactone decarboxylase
MQDIPSLGRFPGVAAADMPTDQAAALEQLVGNRAAVPAPYRVWLQSPGFTACMDSLGRYLRYDSALTSRETELVILACARHCRAAFVFAAHSRLGRQAGLSDAIIDAIARDQAPGLDDGREQCIFDVAVAMLSDPTVSAQLYQRAVATLGHRLIVEVIGLLGLYRATAYTMKFYDVPAPAVAATPSQG